jgi:thymidylate synthase
MNNIDFQYQRLLGYLINEGVEKRDRTGTGTLSDFGWQIRHKMSDGFPLLTTKKMAWKSIVTELLWFLRGDTNIKYLVDNGCHIWDGDAYKNYESEWLKENPPFAGPYTNPCLTQEDFINKIKTDDEFAEKWGELGPIYGKQWRDWIKYEEEPYQRHNEIPIDQIANLISELKTNPDSRRLMVNAWNVGELDQMVLPPCHYGFQVYTRELSIKERMEIYFKQYPDWAMIGEHSFFDKHNIPTRSISLMWNQRSVDTFLGLPFNIASYGLLLEIIAREVNMVPDELIGNLGDVHLYSNHIEQAKEQIGRELTHRERIEKLFETNKDAKSLLSQEEPEVISSLLLDELKIPKRTREPFELPTVTITERNWYLHEKVIEHLGEKTFIQKIESYRPEDFTLNSYQSHPAIKAPLSN